MGRGDARHRRHNLPLQWRQCPAVVDAPDPNLRAALAAAYDIEAPIARGGMAHVYLARERRLDRRVAVKVLPPELAASDANRQRFLREATTDARLLAQHIFEPAPPLATVAPHVPPRVAQIVDRRLAKEAWARFADAAALVRAIAEAVVPPAVPLAVRAFLVRSTHLEAPALIYAFMTGVGLLPATVAAWLSPDSGAARAVATSVLVVALVLPAVVAGVRVRRLLAAGQQRDALVAALAARQDRRREELAFLYGSGTTSFERGIAWLARVALVLATAAVAGGLGAIEVPLALVPLLPGVAVASAATSLLAGLVARARTEQRADPRGERRLRFWRGAPGRWLFRIAGVGFEHTTPIVTILSNSATPA